MLGRRQEMFETIERGCSDRAETQMPKRWLMPIRAYRVHNLNEAQTDEIILCVDRPDRVDAALCGQDADGIRADPSILIDNARNPLSDDKACAVATFVVCRATHEKIGNLL